VPQRVLIAAASVVATAGALAIDMRSYQRFLLLLGAVFVPLLGVLVAHWLLAGAHYTRADVFDAPRVRPGPIVAWAAGFFLYEWLYQPTDLGFWSDWLNRLPTPSYDIGASLPAFALAFVLTGVFQTLSSPRATMTAEPPTSTRRTSSADPSTRA
jgi:purine-cytosine permease-like protein